MAVSYDATVKAARMTAARDQVAGGTLVLMSAANVVLATFTLSAGGGSIAAGVWTLAFAAATVTGAAAAGAGTPCTKAEIRSAGGTARITGLTVGVTPGASDIVLDNANIASGQSVTLSGATITHS